jgi:aspartate ammonia-lyase
LENFKITDIPISLEPRFVQALGYLKKAAAPPNMDLWELPQEITRAIIVACDAVITGELNDQFIVGAIQGGAGTATNMNVNEVIANKALETVQSVRDIVLDKGLVDKVILEESTTFYPDGGERENIYL